MFSDKLKELRTKKGVTQKQVAKAIGKTPRVVGYYENEQSNNKLPDRDILEKLATYFNVSLNYLIGVDESKNSPEVALIDKLIEKTSSNILKWNKIDNNDIPIEIPYSSDLYMKYNINATTGYPEYEHGYFFDNDVVDTNTIYYTYHEVFYFLINVISDYDINGGVYYDFELKILNPNPPNDVISIYNQNVDNSLNELFDIVESSNGTNSTSKIISLINSLNELEED